MKKQEKKYDLFYENSVKAKSLNDDYYQAFEKVMTYVFKHQSQVVKANILLSEVLNQMIEHQENKNNVSLLIPKTIKEYVNKVDKTIHYKENMVEMKHNDSQRYTISGLWMTMCGYIVLLFIKEFLTDHYLIHFSIDFLVAVVAFYIALHNMMNQYKIIKRYQLSAKAFIVELVGMIVGIFVIIMTLKSPFDISFLILVVAYITSKKIFEKELKK